jgi:hypothetical protein
MLITFRKDWFSKQTGHFHHLVVNLHYLMKMIPRTRKM